MSPGTHQLWSRFYFKGDGSWPFQIEGLESRALSGSRIGGKTVSRVLVVDDEPEILLGLQRSLRRQDCEIVGVGCARQAFEVLAKQCVDIIVSDECMPEMTGIAFLAEVRRRYPYVVRIILTGHASLDVAIRAINDGNAFRFLSKPCAPGDLQKALNEALVERNLSTSAAGLMHATQQYLAHHSNERRALADWSDTSLSTPTSSEVASISEAERAVLNLLVMGEGVERIAGMLSTSPECIQRHIFSLLQKFGLDSQDTLVQRARWESGRP